VFKSRFERETM